MINNNTKVEEVPVNTILKNLNKEEKKHLNALARTFSSFISGDQKETQEQILAYEEILKKTEIKDVQNLVALIASFIGLIEGKFNILIKADIGVHINRSQKNELKLEEKEVEEEKNEKVKKMNVKNVLKG